MEKSVGTASTLHRTPHLILTRVQVDSKVLESFLISNRHSNSSQSTLPVRRVKCSNSVITSAGNNGISLNIRKKLVLKRLVAKPTSLIVSIQLKGREFLVERFSKNLINTSTVPSQIQKDPKTPSNITYAKVNEKPQRVIKAPLKSKENGPGKLLTLTLKREEQDKETLCSSNEIHQNAMSYPMATTTKCGTADLSVNKSLGVSFKDAASKDVNEDFKLLEEEVDVMLSQKEQNSSNQNDVLTNSESLVSTNLKASSKHVSDAPNDLSIAGNPCSALPSVLEVESSTSDDVEKETVQNNRLSAILTPRADECEEDSMSTVLTVSPVQKGRVTSCSSTVIPFSASPVVDKKFTSSPSKEKKQVSIELKLATKCSDQETQTNKCDIDPFSTQNKELSTPQNTSAVEHTQQSDEFINPDELLKEEPIIDLLLLMETELLRRPPIKEVEVVAASNLTMPDDPISTLVLPDKDTSVNEVLMEDSMSATNPSEVIIAMLPSSETEQSHPNVEPVVQNLEPSITSEQSQVSEEGSKFNNQVARRPQGSRTNPRMENAQQPSVQVVKSLRERPKITQTENAQQSSVQVVKRSRGRPKIAQTENDAQQPSVVKRQQSGVQVVKRPRGRPRKERREIIFANFSYDTAVKPPAIVKQKSNGISKKKRDKVAKQVISSKESAELITHAFTKLTSEDDGKSGAHSYDSSTHLQTVEDSGYTTSISNSDTSSRSSHVPISQSPLESIVSPILHPHTDLDDFSFDDNSPDVLLAQPDQDPNLNKFQNPDLALSCAHIQPQEIDICVLDSGGLVAETPTQAPDNAESDILQALTSFSFDGVIRCDHSQTMSADPVSDADFIFPELNTLLSPLDMFCQGNELEMANSEDLEDILKSKAVNRCLEDLNLSERINCGALVPDITPVSNTADVSITPVVSTVTEASPSKTITTEQKLNTSVPEVKGQCGTRKIKRLVRKPPGLNCTTNNKTISCTNSSPVSTSLSDTHPETSILSVSKPNSSLLPSSILLSCGQTKSGRTKSGRVSKPSSKLLSSYLNRGKFGQSSSIQSPREDSDFQVPLSPTQPSQSKVSSTEGAGNLSLCDNVTTSLNSVENCSDPAKSMGRESGYDVEIESNKLPASISDTLPQASLSGSPDIAVLNPTSSSSVKLRNFNVNLSRHPAFHYTSHFRFKGPQRVVENFNDNSFRGAVCAAVQRPPSTFSFSIDTNSSSPAVTNSNNCNVSECSLSKVNVVQPSKDRVVKFEDNCKNLETFRMSTPSMSAVSSSLTSSTAWPVLKQSGHHSLANNSMIMTPSMSVASSSLTSSTTWPVSKQSGHPLATTSMNMSLDVFLNEMESTNLSFSKTGDPPLTKSPQERLVRINPSRSFELPSLSETAPHVDVNRARTVKHTDSQVDIETFTFNRALTDSGISDLLSPIHVQSSLDEVLQGESLFGEKLNKNVKVEEPQKANMIGEKLSGVILRPSREDNSCTNESPISPEEFFRNIKRTQTKAAVVMVPEDVTKDFQISESAVLGSPNLEKQVALFSNPSANDIAIKDKQSAVSTDSTVSNSSVPNTCARKIKRTQPKTAVVIVHKDVTKDFQISEDTGLGSPNLENEVTLCSNLSANDIATRAKQPAVSMDSTVSKSPVPNSCVSERNVGKDLPKRVSFQNDLEEDVIDIHAEDADIFETNITSSPLSKLFKKSFTKNVGEQTHGSESLVAKNNSRPLPQEEPESGRGNIEPSPKPPSLHSQNWTSPMKQLKGSQDTFKLHTVSLPEADSPVYEDPPVLVPYKKEQVSQWVAEQQRRVCYNSPRPLSSSPNNSSSPALYSHTQTPAGPWSSKPVSNGFPPRQMSADDPFYSPWPHHQVCPNTSPVFVPESPMRPKPNLCHDPATGGSGSSILEGFCKRFLRGKCDFNPCKFKHAPITDVPLHVIEAALSEGGVKHLRTDILHHHYANDPNTCHLLKVHIRNFTDLIRGILSKNWVPVATNFIELRGVKFYQTFLCRVMEICTQQPLPHLTSNLPEPASVATKIFTDFQARHEPISIQLFHLYLKVLANQGLTARVLETYKMMRGSGVPPNFDVILVLLRLGSTLNHIIFDLLEDLDLCSPPLLCVQQARCVDRLLDVLDCQLLLQHSTRAESWVDKVPGSVLQTLTHNSFLKLYTTFSHHQQWRPLISLLDSCPTYLTSIQRQQLCEILNSAVKLLRSTDKLENILSELAEEKLSEITKEVWEIVIASCIKKQQSQRASNFWHVAYHHKKQLSPEITSSLLALYLSQEDSTSAMALLKQSLADNPAILPPLPLLISLCQAMDSSQDILAVIYSCFFANIIPPMAILECLLEQHYKHKAYRTLTEIVQLSLDHNLLLDKLFYQNVLIELRHWGQDQESVSTVYKTLRNIDSQERTSGSLLRVNSNPTPPPLVSSPKIVSNSETVPRQLFVPRNGGVERGVASGSMSLEDVLQQQSHLQDQSSLIKLIEVNASQGQFGAVASILVSLPSSQSHYDNKIVHTVWKAVSNSSSHSANAFSSLIFSLLQSRSSSTAHANGGALFGSDRWLISQLGIALLKSCEQNQNWQSGFVILHHLHQFGIHYVKLSQPSANLPPSSPVDHSPCLIALMAVNICLHIDQISSALEVLQGCEWAPAKSGEEVNLRTNVLLEVANKCLQKGMKQEGWNCLKAIETSANVKNFVHVITNLHNKLLQISLTFKDIEFSLSVYKNMRQRQLQCLPGYFSLLLQNLISDGQESVAHDLCKAAIADNCYCTLSEDNMFQLTLPSGLVRMELYLLLKDHLNKIGAVTKDKQLQPLLICFSPGDHSELDNVFVSDFNPPLVAKFTFEKNTATISSDNLEFWLNSHDQPLTLTSDTCGRSSVPMTESWPVSANLVKVEPQSNDCVKISAVNCGSPLKGNVEIRRKRLASDALELKFPHVPTSKCPKLDKKQFKEEACRVFVEHLKPHYQDGKFKTRSAYAHLLKTLSLNYFKMLKVKEKILPTAIGDQVKTDIKTIVEKLMEKVHVYSPDMDSELGLASTASSDSL